MALSNRSRAALLNALVGKTSDFGALASAPTLFIAASTADPSADGSTLAEPSTSGTAYARVAISGSDFTAATAANPSLLVSSADKTFPQATLPWGTITHLALLDTSTVGAGNLIDAGALLTPRVIGTGGTLEVSSTNFTLGMG